MAQHRSNEASKRLETIPGIGVIGATAIAATVAVIPTTDKTRQDVPPSLDRHFMVDGARLSL